MKAKLNRTFLLIAGLAILLTITFSTLIFYQLLVNEVVDNLVSSARLLERKILLIIRKLPTSE